MSVENRHIISFEDEEIALVEVTPDGINDDDVAGVVLLVHGLGGQKPSKTHILASQKFSSLGYATVCFDFPGHGESGGTTETLTISKGARLVGHIANVAMNCCPGRPTYFLGASFGSTCILASSIIENAASIVLRSPVSDCQRVRFWQLSPKGLCC